jgi:hypothetical protein
MATVTMLLSPESYGPLFPDGLYKSDGSTSNTGIDFGDLETGTESDIYYTYLRHDGIEPIYNTGFYIRAMGIEWGGYVSTDATAHDPYNPNWFRSGGLKDNGLPSTGTEDYEFMRNVAKNNPEMGLRVHYDRNNVAVRTSGLGYNNEGLNFSPITLKTEAMDYSLSGNPQLDGWIYPEPLDENKLGGDGDEAALGLSILIPEDTEGSGHIQWVFAIRYRHTQ